MADTLSPTRRSWLMGRVGGKNTKPEMIVRRAAHKLGYRYRLHRKNLPGRPDLAFPRLRKALFVRGCFWHRHGCKKTTTPKTNATFWQDKFSKNIKRDRKSLEKLRELGWDGIVVWECQTQDQKTLSERLLALLGDRNAGTTGGR